MNQKGAISVIAAIGLGMILLLIVGGLGVLVYHVVSNNGTMPQHGATNNSDWQVYTGKTFTFKYPKDWRTYPPYPNAPHGQLERAIVVSNTSYGGLIGVITFQASYESLITEYNQQKNTDSKPIMVHGEQAVIYYGADQSSDVRIAIASANPNRSYVVYFSTNKQIQTDAFIKLFLSGLFLK